MNFNAYIERQKKIIRTRHEGETYLFEKGEVIMLTETDRLFAELDRSCGLNTKERMSFKSAV